MAVWIGGVVLLARVVLAGPGEEDLVHAVRGFSRISNPAIVAHGRQRARPAVPARRRRAVQHRHGRVLLLKTVVVAAMLFVGMTARQVAQRRLARASELTAGDRRPPAPGVRHRGGDRRRRASLLSGWLLALPTGKVPDERRRPGFDVARDVRRPGAGLDLELFARARPGRARQRLRVERATLRETGLSDLPIDVRPAGRHRGAPIDHPADPAHRRRRRRVARRRRRAARRGRHLDDPGAGHARRTAT